jgi:hypothetical protein
VTETERVLREFWSATIYGATEAARELLGQARSSVEDAWAEGGALDLESAMELATAGSVVETRGQKG